MSDRILRPTLAVLALIAILSLLFVAGTQAATRLEGVSARQTIPATLPPATIATIPPTLPVTPNEEPTGRIVLPLILRVDDSATQGAAEARPWPVTHRGIHVFNDQLTQGTSAEQVTFCATHYAGTQKMIRCEADRLRTVNPDIMILHYRLGHALGYRGIQGNCNPTGGYIQIISGDEWIQEWPGEAALQESWFYHWPESSQTRLLNCDWGWYLMAIDDPGWRAHWQAEVLAQLQANDDDGVFLDSLSVPNYLGHTRFDPNLPAVDATFEAAWTQRIEDWLAWLQTQPLGDYWLVPNVGSWITTRDATLYEAADGMMIEGFALEADASPYPLFDWRLQMGHMIEASKRDQALIAQSYAIDPQERMFTLGCYLLVKGDHTYLNIEDGLDPEWWPEYDLPIGAPTRAVTQLDELVIENSVLYGRLYDNARVLVNPTSPWDGSGQTVNVTLSSTHYQAETTGGGAVPESGIPSGSVDYRAVNEITLAPYSAAVLFYERP